MSRQLDPDEKLMHIAAQLRACEMGITQIMTCPYCGGSNDFSGSVPPDLCCEKFSLAACAVTAREESNELVDFAHRLEDKAEGQAVFN